MAVDELPPLEERNLLLGLPRGAGPADYQALPPGHTATLLQQIATEREHFHAGQRRTSRIEAREGRLLLHLRAEHLIKQLGGVHQPKITSMPLRTSTCSEQSFPGPPSR